MIRCINRYAAINFDFDPNADLDEGSIETYSRFFCVHQCNKDKPEKLETIYLYWLTASSNLFWPLDMYQEKKEGNIDMHCRENQLPTTMKAFINAVLDSNIANYHCGACKTFLDNMYACPELFPILFE